MPLVTKATAVSGPSSGAMVAATAGSAGSFDGNDHHVLWAEAGGVRLGGKADVDGAVRHGDSKAMGLNGGEVGASSDQGGFVA